MTLGAACLGLKDSRLALEDPIVGSRSAVFGSERLAIGSRRTDGGLLERRDRVSKTHRRLVGPHGLVLVVHLRFVPCRGRLTFSVLPEKVSKERRARDGDFPLNFHNRAGMGKTRFAQTVPHPFFRPLTKIQGAIKGSNGQTSGVRVVAPWQCWCGSVAVGLRPGDCSGGQQLRLPLCQPPHERLALRDLRELDVFVGLVRLFDIARAAHHRGNARA